MWVEVVPKGSEYDLVMHDGGEDIALATCHTDEGDAVILAIAFAAYEALAMWATETDAYLALQGTLAALEGEE